jgi:hypothetical protein
MASAVTNVSLSCYDSTGATNHVTYDFENTAGGCGWSGVSGNMGFTTMASPVSKNTTTNDNYNVDSSSLYMTNYARSYGNSIYSLSIYFSSTSHGTMNISTELCGTASFDLPDCTTPTPTPTPTPSSSPAPYGNITSIPGFPDASTWPFSVNEWGIYYIAMNTKNESQYADCWQGGTGWGGCYILATYSDNICYPNGCIFDINSGSGWTGLTWSADQTGLINSWYYKNSSEGWISTTPKPSFIKVDQRYPISHSMWGNIGSFYSRTWRHNFGTNYDSEIGNVDRDHMVLWLGRNTNQYTDNPSGLLTVPPFIDNPGGFISATINNTFVTVKDFLFNLVDPSKFLEVLDLTTIKQMLITKAPIAYVYHALALNVTPVTELTNVPTITLNILGVDYIWHAPAFMAGTLSTIKTAITVLLWSIFGIYIWHATRSFGYTP